MANALAMPAIPDVQPMPSYILYPVSRGGLHGQVRRLGDLRRTACLELLGHAQWMSIRLQLESCRLRVVNQTYDTTALDGGY